MIHTDFSVLGADYSGANEHCGRVIIDHFGYVEPHLDEMDNWVALPVRLIHSQATGFGLELGPYAFDAINGLMSVIHGMDCAKGLSLILHTPGGQTNAAETFVSYLRTKFTDIEVIVPTFAMSAGTMISLSADKM